MRARWLKMDRESVSYWADIKKYEDILANEPESYCFTLLSELYRKLGLLDDAITVANRGIGLHPEYAGGYMAAGRAYFEKGMKAESREALERVVRVTPDNLLAQKLLCQIYLEQGKTECAINTLKVIELLNPGDVESRLMLDAFTNAEGRKEADASSENTPAFVAEIAPSEIDFVDDVEDYGRFEAELLNKGYDNEADIPAAEGHLATATLAELYVSQGFIDRAVDVYQQLLEEQPGNRELEDRMAQLKGVANGIGSLMELQEPAEWVENPDFVLEQDETSVSGELCKVMSRQERVISILESWLRNIERGRCVTEANTPEYR